MSHSIRKLQVIFTVSFFALSILFTPVSALASPKKLVFAIDGFSYSAFQAARQRGLFSDFNSAGRHIAPYPSMTEPSWTEILGAKEVFGPKGNVGSVEASFVDSTSLEIHDDPRNVMIRYSTPTNFMRAFDYLINPALETMMYFPGHEVVNIELGDLEKEASEKLLDPSRQHAILYVSAVDALAHTQKDELFPLLMKLSEMIKRVKASYRAKGIPVETWLISDHGNAGKFEEGKPESYLTGIQLNSAVAAAGLKLVQKGSLTRANEIAMPILALGNMGDVYFKDLSKRRAFATATLQNPAVDLVTWPETNQWGTFVVVLGRDADRSISEAHVSWNAQGYAYESIQGNPLQIPDSLVSHMGAQRFLSDADFFSATKYGPYPDALYRLAANAKKQVENEPDLIVNLKQGYCFNGSLSSLVHMVRTHGSLGTLSSLGLLASDQSYAKVPDFTRSSDVLKVVGISSAAAFHESADLFAGASGVHAIRPANAPAKPISTRISDYSPDLLFRRFGKILSTTLDWFDPNEMESLQKVVLQSFKASAHSSESPSLANSLKKIDYQTALKHVDEILQIRALISSEKDPHTLSAIIENKLTSIPGLEPLKSILNSSSKSSIDVRSVDFVRKSMMKLYSSPFVLNDILNLPEDEAVADLRDHAFAAQWYNHSRPQIKNDPDQLFRDGNQAQKLFHEIFQERQLAHDLSPATFPHIYEPSLDRVPGLTFVFIPGIYNELFDKEIFARGLRSLQQTLGVRVLYADVDGRCDSENNAQTILQTLKNDTRARLTRGYPRPRYMILGYSKGAVDASEALLLDEAFAREQILGLTAIASPLQGTQIVESAELPAEITRDFFSRPLPAQCDGHGASRSVNRATREQFWAKNLAKLASLTRYYSVSFASNIKDAHPWMKICKTIAKFNTPNDGVVTVERSHFPEALHAINFGTINADHLAGILASSFPQDAFLEAVAIALHEAGAYSVPVTQAWFNEIAPKSSALIVDYHRRTLGSGLIHPLSSIIQAPGPIPAPAQGDLGWFLPVAVKDYALRTPVSCRNEAKAIESTKQLMHALKATPYSLKPTELHCNADGSLQVSITVRESPIYNFWTPGTKESHTVRTLGQLVDLLLSDAMLSGKNILETGEQHIPLIPKSNRKPLVIPRNTVAFASDHVLDLKKMSKTMASTIVEPMQLAKYPNGIQVIFDHSSMKSFREEYQFSYESTSPAGMDDNLNGYAPWIDRSSPANEVALRMRSRDNSIRLTTSSLKLNVGDFPNFKIRLKTLKGPNHPDSAKGGSGKDDSAFQIWFTLRNIHGASNVSTVPENTELKLFGYFWGEENDKGKTPPPGSLFENYYSKKNFVITTLPESWQLTLESGLASRNKWYNFDRNLMEDLKKAYPNVNPADWEVVSITLQTDSNDTHSDSEVYLKSFSFEPKH